MAPILNTTLSNGTKVVGHGTHNYTILQMMNTTDYSPGISLVNTLTTMENICNEDIMTTVARPSYSLAFDILLPFVCFCGMIGSIFTVVVLSQKAMRTSTNMYLIALASADLIFLAILTTQGFREVGQTDEVYNIYFKYSIIILLTAMLASVWMTVALAIERYIAICHPLRASNMCTIKRARCVIVAVYLLALICRSPQFWEYKVSYYWDDCEKRDVAELDFTDFSFDKVYLTTFLWIVDGVITAIIPFIALFILNIRLIVEVRRSSRYLSYSLSSGSNARYVISREEVQITIMLISIVTVFFICEAPFVIHTAISGIFQHVVVKQVAGLFEIMPLVTRVLAALKCTLNFVLYCWFSEKFWQTFKSMFCVKYCMKKCKSKRLMASRHGSWTNGTATSFLKRSSKDASRETSAM